ncbi:hypothetical protein C8046_03775 [Serinibacter arcticus]|uniref:D-inositol 3-phosphate glycosyltransferase n=1 Tax=Serinibacter arcticus TaxID=1655435 RepID=A0A2U1ZSN1_9MICO|nr:glycosyltransferase family 1 protein [Serinibacter arcticus]PWD49932.1 hypothetical protein C8046_03775 [Serinibacter arcticus]
MTALALLHLDDAGHGVDRYARTVAAAVARLDPAFPLLRWTPDVALPPRVHLHFTDRLWGADAEEAAGRIEALAARSHLTVTLHDVPQDSDGPGRLPRRLACYRRVVAAAAAVVVNSEHERRLLREAFGSELDVTVIPLPVPGALPAPTAWASDGSVAVLGFFYPGKGHREAVDAVAALGLDPSPPVVALGRASAGHEGELAELVEHARRHGVRLESTGFLSDADLVARSRAVAVPVVAHQHVSASGSLTDWIAAGRRPLVVDSPYFREMAELRPGTTTPITLEGLSTAIAHALAHPDTTWQDASAVTRPDLDDTARAYLDLWRSR